MRAHEGLRKKNGYMKVQANIKRLAMPKIVRMERLKHGASWSSLFTPSTTYPHTCTSRSWLYDLFTLWVRSLALQNIWNKYALTFLPTLSSTKAFLEVREGRQALVRIPTLWANESVTRGTCFYFENFLKTSGCNLEPGMGKWCFMNRSISQPPKIRRKPKAPWRIR